MKITGEYDTIFVAHRDVRGVLAALTVHLSDRSVNIAFMRTYRTERGGAAYTVFELDDLPQGADLTDLLESLRAHPEVRIATLNPRSRRRARAHRHRDLPFLHECKGAPCLHQGSGRVFGCGHARPRGIAPRHRIGARRHGAGDRCHARRDHRADRASRSLSRRAHRRRGGTRAAGSRIVGGRSYGCRAEQRRRPCHGGSRAQRGDGRHRSRPHRRICRRGPGLRPSSCGSRRRR